MTITNGILSSAIQIHSLHYDCRPNEVDISLLVIHNISLPAGKFGGSYVEDFFVGNLDCEAEPSFKELSGVRVSAHCFIKRNGEVIQFVNFQQRAWHAGQSEYKGRENCNDFSIGIELEGTDTHEYTEAQYKNLAKITKEILITYPKITNKNICGHSDIAPDRKTDPGFSFDWQRYLSMIVLITE